MRVLWQSALAKGPGSPAPPWRETKPSVNLQGEVGLPGPLGQRHGGTHCAPL